MTIPYMMNCSHSDDGWCLDCVSQMGRENEQLRELLLLARTHSREKCGITTRKFAAVLGISPARLSELTFELPTTAPDFVD